MRKFVLISIILFMFIGLYYFISNPKISKNPAPFYKVIVLLDWFANTNHTGLYVAKEKGFFREQALDVDILEPGQNDGIQMVASGKADFAISSQEAVTLARAKDIPVLSIAAVIQHNTSAFASLGESNIKSVKDFEGKRYGGWGSPIEEVVLKAVMGQVHADYSKVKNITIGETDFFKTIGRDSDFQWIFYGWDAVEAERRGKKLNVIMLRDLNPVLDYYTPVIITNEKNIREKKNLVKRFMAATEKGYEFAVKSPKSSAEILLKNVPGLNKELVLLSQDWLSKQYKGDVSQWGTQDKKVWQRYSSWLFEQKLMDKKVNSELSFTNEFLPR